ncbi:hypothetical protein ACWT_0042 [Actinoplanes sp. SE50]|uniref:hypothetical protein n=1 Tax=unclassified Actinoplanes TaxID=2626549 RepID=UPI00023ECF86|nr:MULTISPECIES: hypothetical protein [unclassified Actinoplanes]AEV81056.1 hypothetical protein ACPL_157 [Actinoplanes sp. SE50/110]ATO79457.1 hypothetical protein ACWT_0042 [Actinoplanes sp. SE50]SLL96857.1 hypothetical protein ACSP50_0044 [Actinoplanes sp. SE50/110]
MTIGSENLSNGSSTAQDRFSGGVSAYRQGRREALHADLGDGELLSRGSSGLPTRSPGHSRSIDSRSLEPASALDRAAKLPSLDLHGLTEPVFSASWSDGTNTSMADHPLLRGLLLELPARGTLPPSDWLDRWFEAARSILELLYVQEAKKQAH